MHAPAALATVAAIAGIARSRCSSLAWTPAASTTGFAPRSTSRQARPARWSARTAGRDLIRLGGATIGDKLGIVGRFLELADLVRIGGGMCFPFLAALGHSVGRSLCGWEDVESARVALATAAGSTDRLALPRDLLLARWGEDAAAVTRMLDGVDVPDGWMGLDIGAKTADWYGSRVAAATTVFWNGPVGRFELPQFAAGTRAIAEAVASTSASTVVGGGETSQALRRLRLQERMNHLSSAGAAMLAFLEGRQLPGLQVLMARRSGRRAARSARCDTPLAGRAEPA
jgi:phosphoglycerate kinase